MCIQYRELSIIANKQVEGDPESTRDPYRQYRLHINQHNREKSLGCQSNQMNHHPQGPSMTIVDSGRKSRFRQHKRIPDVKKGEVR